MQELRFAPMAASCLSGIVCTPSKGGNHDVARGQVLLKCQPVAKMAVARHGANPILLVEPFRLEVRWQEPLIILENKI